MKKLCSSIKDNTLKKYILEDFLTKINKLTPNVNNKKNYNYSKRKNSSNYVKSEINFYEISENKTNFKISYKYLL